MVIDKNTTALILCHYYNRAENAGGPPQEVRDYLLPRVATIAYIEHPFPGSSDRRSTLTIYRNGKMVKKMYSLPLFGPGWIYYLADLCISISFVLSVRQKIDVCIALDPLNTINMLPFRFLGRIQKLVFYTIDYTPRRFPQPILNAIYQWTDRTSCRFADTIWVLSENLTKARVKNGMPRKDMALVVLLPMGANLARIRPLPIARIRRHQIIFVGALMEKQGIQLVLEALPNVIKKIPDVTFVIAGTGEYEHTLKAQTEKLGLTKHVTFTGFVKKHADVEKLLCESAIGIAPYAPTSDNYTYFTDPGKPKLYLGCGLPVIITDVPAIAKVIQKAQAGMIVSYRKHSIENALTTLLSDDARYKKMRENALTLSQQYDTNTLIRQAIDSTK